MAVPPFPRLIPWFFPGEFNAIERSLNVFVGLLLNEDVRYHTPLFRGVFASTRREGTPVSLMRKHMQIAKEPAALESMPQQPDFLRDLFDTILQCDRALSTALGPKRTIA